MGEGDVWRLKTQDGMDTDGLARLWLHEIVFVFVRVCFGGVHGAKGYVKWVEKRDVNSLRSQFFKWCLQYIRRKHFTAL